MEIIILILIALVALTVLILVHEFGHFIVAKKSGVWVEEFGVGLPPRAISRKFGETIYSLNWLPVGGFVRLHGEASGDMARKPARAFYNQSKLVRVVVSMAGIVMNYVFALVVFFVVANIVGVALGVVEIVGVAPESPAERADIVAGDRIVSLNGGDVVYEEFFLSEVGGASGGTVSLVVLGEDGAYRDLEVFVRTEVPEGEGAMGITLMPERVVEGFSVANLGVYGKYAYDKTAFLTVQIVRGFGSIFSQAKGGEVPDGVAGPAGILAILAEIYRRLGFMPLLEFTAIISINLALINLVPFPPLDGSRVLFILFEGVLGKKFLARFEEKIYMVGMAVLILLIVVLTATEIPKILSAGSLSAFVESIIGV